MRSSKPKAKAKNKHVTTPWNGATDVPRAGMPDAIALEKKYKASRRWFVVGVLAAGVVLPLWVTSAAMKPVDVTAQMQASTPGRALAQNTVQNWLDLDPSPIPGGQVLSWEGATIVDYPVLPTATNTDFPIEVEQHTIMVVVPSTQALFSVGVQIASSDALGNRIMGEPSIIAQAPSARDTDWGNLDTWMGAKTAMSTPAAQVAVASWAKAFTSGDPAILRQTVGDPDSGHSYMSLIGVASVESNLNNTALAMGATAEDPHTIIGRVVLKIKWNGIDYGDNKSAPASTYDVLIQRANTASPVVVAWGPAGSGPVLEPYSNAIVGRELKNDGLLNETLVDPGKPTETVRDEPTQEPTQDAPAEPEPQDEPAPEQPVEEPEGE